MSNLSDVLKSALDLDARERAVLAEKLLASLDGLDEAEAERLWAEEAERRLQELREGRSTTVSAEDVASKVHEILG